MAALIQWNLGRGFLQYINDRDIERAKVIANRISNRYQQDNSWDWIEQNNEWRRLTAPERLRSQTGNDVRHKAPPPAPTSNGLQPPPIPRLDRGQRRSPSRGPNGRGPRRGSPRIGLGPRLALFDATQNQLAGRRLNISSPQINLQPIVVDGTSVGWLAFRPLRKVRSTRDIDFLRQQTQTFVLTSLLILLAAGLLGYLLARHLTQPLVRLKGAVSELSLGNYSNRIDPKGRDEIADLSNDVNSLAHILGENLSARQRWIADISHKVRSKRSAMA